MAKTPETRQTQEPLAVVTPPWRGAHWKRGDTYYDSQMRPMKLDSNGKPILNPDDPNAKRAPQPDEAALAELNRDEVEEAQERERQERMAIRQTGNDQAPPGEDEKTPSTLTAASLLHPRRQPSRDEAAAPRKQVVSSADADNGPRNEGEPPEATPEQKKAASLLKRAEAGKVQYFKLRADAKHFLGDDMPSTKADILEALRHFSAPVSPRPTGKQEPARPAAKPADKEEPAPGEEGAIDLAAWARGERQYLAGDVYKAIDQQYARRVVNMADAVDFLVDEGVISAREARKDVKRS